MPITIYEFGKANINTLVLIHPAMVSRDYFADVIDLLERDFHLIIPAVLGFDRNNPSDFTSIEDVSLEIERWLIKNDYTRICLAYGASMGGAILAKILANKKINITTAILDGAIMPYTYPYLVTRFIALKDFLMVGSAKLLGLKIYEPILKKEGYRKKDLAYLDEILNSVSFKTIWRTFDSTNNYTLPKFISMDDTKIEYWYSIKEERERRTDISFAKNTFENISFKIFTKTGHAELALKDPQKLATEIKNRL